MAQFEFIYLAATPSSIIIVVSESEEQMQRGGVLIIYGFLPAIQRRKTESCSVN